VIPSRLDHSDFGIGEVVDGVVQNIRWGYEVGVEDRDEFGIGEFQAIGEGAGFIAGSVFAMDVLDVEPFVFQMLDGLLGDFHGGVCAVIEDLYLEFVFWVVDFAGVFDNAFGDELLIEHRQLDADFG